MDQEKYIVRVQLISSDKKGERVTRSFDYEVSPTTSPRQDPLFIRAEKFYRELQTVLGEAGKVTVTGRDHR